MLGLCRQQYYRWRSNRVTDSEWDTAHLANAILDTDVSQEVVAEREDIRQGSISKRVHCGLRLMSADPDLKDAR